MSGESASEMGAAWGVERVSHAAVMSSSAETEAPGGVVGVSGVVRMMSLSAEVKAPEGVEGVSYAVATPALTIEA